MKTLHIVLLAAASAGVLIYVGRKLAPVEPVKPKAPGAAVVDGVKGLVSLIQGIGKEPTATKKSAGTSASWPMGVELGETPRSAYDPRTPFVADSNPTNTRGGRGGPATERFSTYATRVQGGVEDESPFHFGAVLQGN